MAVFSYYALWKLAMRGIDRDDVELVLADPQCDFASPTGRHCYVRTVGNRLIQVVVESFDHDQVVTAYEKSPRES